MSATINISNSLIATITPQVQDYLAYMAARPNGEEIEYRYCFEDLFKTLQLPFMNKTSIVQEDRRSGIEMEGMPDFFVWNDADKIYKSLVGFIECKKPSYNIEKLIESEQIKKYSKTCENIIITNYHRFILLQKGKPVHDVELTNEPIAIQHFLNLLQDFYDYNYPYINTKKTLVATLAAQSFYYSVALREFIDDKTNGTDNFYIKFNGLFSEYEKSINYHYELADFCDIYAQSLVYGLLLARLDKGEQLNEQKLNYLDNIPNEYSLLYEFLVQAYDSRYFPTEIKIALTNIGKNINLINTEAITIEFQKINNGKQNIAVYLYEDFLAQYDKFRGTEHRKEGGVYYTPSEATDFITRNVNDIIKTHFKLPKGYLSPDIKVLDFACGTGTFLHSIFELILPNNPDKLQKKFIKQKITQDIYGFELLFTPYIIAHTFLARYLKNKDITLENKERLGVYLTNTLDISNLTISDFLPDLQKEHEKAKLIKNKETILAIVGNPPYFNGKSYARKGVIDEELKKYKTGLNEKKTNLDDEYIKFIRFAEWKIEQSKMGIVGIITNNSYLDGVTHRKMRKHLYETFDEIYIVNLHGNSRKKEPDKNIFDIMVGVSIIFLVKHKNPAKKKIVKYFSTLENNMIKRQEKLDFLANSKISDLQWTELHPEKDEYFWFVEKDFSQKKEYNKFWNVTDIFAHYNSGIQTKNDEFTIQYSKNKIETIIEDFKENPFDIKSKYNLKDRHWTTKSAYESLKAVSFNKKFIKQVQYRPFDNRYTFLHEKAGFLARPRYETNKHFENENIGLCFTRQLLGDSWKHIFISKNAIDGCTVSLKSREWTYLAPLYIYNGGNGYAEIDFDGHKRYANFTQNFIKNYIEKINFKPNSEEILAYIYAVLHSTVYRKKYVEFLKTDFPAVPFTTNKEIFNQYAKLGQQLIDLHLLHEDALQCVSTDNEIRVNYDFDSDFIVEKISHDNNKLHLFTTDNKTVTFEGVTSQIYNFEIGSYKPIEKWLKYRIKDEVTLTFTDLLHLKNMIIALKNTILIMHEIEKLGEAYLQYH